MDNHQRRKKPRSDPKPAAQSTPSSPSTVLARWCAVCDSMLLKNLEMYKTIVEYQSYSKSMVQDLLLRLSMFLKTQELLHQMFIDRLRVLKQPFHIDSSETCFNVALKSSHSPTSSRHEHRDKSHLLQLQDAISALLYGDIPIFLRACTKFDLVVPIIVVQWLPLYIAIWSTRHHHLPDLSCHGDLVDPQFLNHEFQHFLCHPYILQFLQVKPSDFEATDFEKIKQLANDSLNTDVYNVPVERKGKTRGLATETTYGKPWPDGSLRDHKNTDIKVFLFKCPYCSFLTRIKQTYFENHEHPLRIVCLKEYKETGPPKQTPYVDIKNSSISLPLSKDRAFIRFRTHLRQCMKKNGIQPDEHHIKFFGDYDTRSHRSKWFKNHATYFSPPGAYI